MRRQKTQLNIRRLWALSFALLLLLGTLPAAYAAESGTCGDGLSWELADGVLTVAGSGEMTDYSEENPAPWHDRRNEILSLVLPEGLTGVGDYAFYECAALERVSLPDSVERIGEKAFYGCTGMKLLALSHGLKVIGERAFERCWSLTALNLPQGLTTIGDAAFWRCHGLLAVTVPESVTELGSAVFTYCDSMLHADIQAEIDRLPEWTFYGCDSLSAVTLSHTITGVDGYAFTSCENLSTVRYQGSTENADQIGQDIRNDLDTFDPSGVVAGTGNSGSSSTFTEDGEQTHVQTDMVTQTGNATVSTTINSTLGAGNVGDIQIGSVIENSEGWPDVVDQTDGIIQQYGNSMTENGQQVEVTVSILDGSNLSGEQLSQLAGKPVKLTVQTMNGSSWTVDLSTMDGETLTEQVDLSYTLTETQMDEMEAEAWYALKFASGTQINAEVLIRLPGVHSRKTATLFYRSGGDWTEAQSSMVDDDGYAHFYLAGVDAETEYLIAVNLVNQTTDAIVPDNMKREFDITDTLAPMDYVITGRTSSWNMEIGQVTLILVGVLVAAVAVIGVTLFLLNKRKLKKGYVVDLDEYEIDS